MSRERSINRLVPVLIASSTHLARNSSSLDIGITCHSRMEVQTVTYSEDSSSVLRGFTPPTIPKTVPLGTEISSQFSGSDSPIDDFLVDASRVRALLGVRTVFLGSANELSFPVQEFDPGSLSRAPDIVEC